MAVEPRDATPAPESAHGLVRYTRFGLLDRSFGIRGGPGSAYALALQPDGKIVVAGGSPTLARKGDFLLVRYNPDGSLDS